MWWFLPTNKSIEKKLNRLAYSWTTILFVVTLMVQLGLVEFFQVKLDIRDNKILDLLKVYNQTYPDCVKNNFNQRSFSMLSKELFLFIYFQLFILWLGFNAITNHHVYQAKIVASLNASGALYGIVRLVETKIPVDAYNEKCGQFGRIDAQYLSNDVPNIVVMLVLACWLGYLTKLLNDELGESIYRKIGNDKRMREMFKTRLTFLMLLKINVFYLIFMLFPVFILYTIFFGILHLSITLIALGTAYAAYRAIPKEDAKAMHYFVTIWILVLIDWAATLVGSFILASSGSYFMLFFASQYVIYGIVTITHATKVIQTFGKGMNEYVGQEILSHKLESFVPIIKVINYDTPELRTPAPVAIKE